MEDDLSSLSELSSQGMRNRRMETFNPDGLQELGEGQAVTIRTPQKKLNIKPTEREITEYKKRVLGKLARYKVVKGIGKLNKELAESIKIRERDSTIIYKDKVVAKEGKDGKIHYGTGRSIPGSAVYEFERLVTAARGEYLASIAPTVDKAAKRNELGSPPEWFEMQPVVDDAIPTYENELYQNVESFEQVAETAFGGRRLTKQEKRELGGIREYIRTVKEDRRERQRYGVVKKPLEENKAELRANLNWIKGKVSEAKRDGDEVYEELWEGYRQLTSLQLD